VQTWVFALPVEREIYFWDEAKGDYVSRYVSEKWARGLVDCTNRAIQAWREDAPEGLTPYYPPVRKDHEATAQRYGDIFEAKVEGEGDKRGVYLLVNWLDWIWDQIQSLGTQHVSIGTVAGYVDYKGRVYESLINELSITDTPRLKDIGTIQDTVSLRLIDVLPPNPNKQGESMDEQEMIALIDALLKRVEALEAAHAEMIAKMEVKEEAVEVEDMEAGDMNPEEDIVAEDMYEEKEEEIVAQLADKIYARAEKVALEKLKGMRLGDAPAGKAPQARKADKLAAAKAQGLTGLAAITASLK
jgi:hypothetical protein